MTKNTTVLITGANRGIGEGLLATYLSRPNVTAITAVRNPAGANATALKNLPLGNGSELIIVKIDSKSETDAQNAIDTLKTEHQIKQLDIVIANAGIARYTHKVGVLPLSEIIDHQKTNTIGPVLLFQATEPLMKVSTKCPKFVVISSSLGAISAISTHPQPSAAYGSSKAALNHITCKIHQEYGHITAFPLHPGYVHTEMGNIGAKNAGMEKADVTIKDSVAGLMKKIDRATRENSGGKFMTWDDTPLSW
ncbi:NAD(P)-binding protein [Stipitochalara longipes BDJ]|nr:NAD(P)-binding protein [Stipitochalara longipes BDJ]